MTAPRLVLASASPRRRELLAYLGVTFEVVPADVDETTAETDPARAAEELALRKAAAIAPDCQGAAIIGSDTIVALDGRMLGKPVDAEDAHAMLSALRGRTHEVLTGVAVEHAGARASRVERSLVRMREYTDEEMAAWIATGAAFDKAGAYASQDPVFHPAAAIEGCTCSVIGLPLWTLRCALSDVGIEVATPALARCATCPARPGA